MNSLRRIKRVGIVALGVFMVSAAFATRSAADDCGECWQKIQGGQTTFFCRGWDPDWCEAHATDCIDGTGGCTF